MFDPEIVKTIATAVGGLKSLTDIAATITNAKQRQELNGIIAELQTALLAARQQMLEMQTEHERVLQENKLLKEAKAPRERPKIKWGCYQFDGEEGLFCTACYDTRGQKILTTRLNSSYRSCPVCKVMFGAG
jgi:hypothetical protein